MIVLDTHIWIWWVHNDPLLPSTYQRYLHTHASSSFGVSIISCWEVALLDAGGKITLPLTIGDWLHDALTFPGIQLLDLTPEIVVDANHLPDNFHRDPADRLIVATARQHGCPLITQDAKIRSYPHVQIAP